MRARGGTAGRVVVAQPRNPNVGKELSLDIVENIGINALMFWRLLPTPVTIPEKFAHLILVLLGYAGERFRSGPHPLPDPAVLVAIQARLWRIKKRIASLLARIEAGTLKPPRPYQPRERPSRPEGDPRPGPIPRPRPTGPRLPTYRAWLYRLLPARESEMSPVALASGLLAQLLQSQEVASLVARHRSLAEALRPLCRMVGVDPSLLPPPRPRRPRTRRAPPQSPPPPDPAPPDAQAQAPRRGLAPDSLLWSGAEPLAKRFRIRGMDAPRMGGTGLRRVRT